MPPPAPGIPRSGRSDRRSSEDWDEDWSEENRSDDEDWDDEDWSDSDELLDNMGEVDWQ